METELLKLGIKKKLMEEKGLSEEEAEQYANMVLKKDNYDEKAQYIDTTMGVLARSSEIMQAMPPEARQAIAPVLSQSLMSLSPESSTITEDMKKIAIELKMMDMILGTKKSEDSDIKKEITELKKELLEKKEKEKEEKYLEEISSLRRELMRIREEMQESKEPAEPVQAPDPAHAIIEKIEEGESYKKTLKSILGVSDVPKDTPKTEDVIKMLKEQGYEIKGPPGWQEIQDMQRKWQEEVEKAKAEEREKINREVEREIQKERISATKEIVNTVIKQVVSIFAGGSAQPAATTTQPHDANKIREMAKRAKAISKEAKP